MLQLQDIDDDDIRGEFSLHQDNEQLHVSEETPDSSLLGLVAGQALDDDEDVFVVDHIDGYEDRPVPCMLTGDALLAWSKNPKQFKRVVIDGRV